MDHKLLAPAVTGRRPAMTERILKTPMEVESYIDQVRSLGDANRSALGFLPASAYTETAIKGCLWVVVDQATKDLMGYLLFGGTYPHLKVFQVHVLPEFRSRGLARRLLKELREHGEENSFQTISARVATELDANRFWQSIGFRIIRRVAGGARSGRMLNVYLFELDTPSLFREIQIEASSQVEGVQQITYPSRPILKTPSYVIDLNVFFDVVGKRDTGESARILSSAFNSEIKLLVTSEFIRELERHSSEFENDPVLEFARGLPVLPELSADTLAPLMEEIRKILFPDTTEIRKERPNEVSDRIHLASCIHHRAYGFITRDTAILRRAKELHAKYDLRVISPADLYDSHQEPGPPPPLTVAVGQQETSVSELHERDRAEVEELFLAGLGVGASEVFSCLSPGTTHSPRVRLVARAEKEIIGIGSWSPNRSIHPDTTAYLYVNEDHPSSDSAISYILESSINSGSYGQLSRLDLETGPRQIRTREVAISRGFQPSDLQRRDVSGSLTKISLKGMVTRDSWSSFVSELEEIAGLVLPNRIPRYDELVNTGISLRKKSNDRRSSISLFDFETLISPGTLICPGRTAVMIPIRPAYADELLPSTVRQIPALPGKEAALRLERAYFSGGRGLDLLTPAKIAVFYISRERQEAVAAARITFSGNLTKTQAALNLGRQGVLTEEEIQQTANSKGEVTAFTFDNVMTFSQYIAYPDLKEMGCVGPTNLVTAEELTHNSLCRIVERAFRGNL